MNNLFKMQSEEGKSHVWYVSYLCLNHCCKIKWLQDQDQYKKYQWGNGVADNSKLVLVIKHMYFS